MGVSIGTKPPKGLVSGTLTAMSTQFMFVGGTYNGQFLEVQEPGLTQRMGEDQYILHDVDGREIYALVNLCYREVRSLARILWKRQNNLPEPPKVVQAQVVYSAEDPKDHILVEPLDEPLDVNRASQGPNMDLAEDEVTSPGNKEGILEIE